MRATVAGKLGLSEGNGFGMLAALGADCAGAVMVLPERSTARRRRPARPSLSAKAKSASCSATFHATLSVSTSTPGGCA